MNGFYVYFLDYTTRQKSFPRFSNFDSYNSSQAMSIIFAHMKRFSIWQVPPEDRLFSSTQFCTATPENEWV